MAGSSTDGTEGTPEGVPYAGEVPDAGGVPNTSRRALEIWTASAVALLGGIVAVESLTHDIGWNETGPGSGYFPFRVGVLLMAVAAARFAQSLRIQTHAVFATGDEVRRSLSVFLPTAALVAAMLPLGCYVPTVVYLTWMMRRHGGYGWMASSAFGVTVMAAFFVVFDLWFGVPLAKGPLEAAFGIY